MSPPTSNLLTKFVEYCYNLHALQWFRLNSWIRAKHGVSSSDKTSFLTGWNLGGKRGSLQLAVATLSTPCHKATGHNNWPTLQKICQTRHCQTSLTLLNLLAARQLRFNTVHPCRLSRLGQSVKSHSQEVAELKVRSLCRQSHLPDETIRKSAESFRVKLVACGRHLTF